jgi:hypothetical protein
MLRISILKPSIDSYHMLAMKRLVEESPTLRSFHCLAAEVVICLSQSRLMDMGSSGT